MSRYDLAWPLTRWPWKFVVDLLSRGQYCSKFDWNRTIPGWVIRNLANFAPNCDLDLWPLDLKLLWLFWRHVFKLCVKFERNRTIRGSYSRFSTFSQSNFSLGPKHPNRSQGCVDRTAANLQRTQGDYCWLTSLFQKSDINIVLHFQTRAAQSRVMLKRRQISHFWPPLQKLGEGWTRSLGQFL